MCLGGRLWIVSGGQPADPGKRMVGKVLTGHGISRDGNSATSLIGGHELSDSMLCDG